ncbi:MAG: SulP family inorganic anion transporter [Arenimonas sp.]|nr:SulP family inorganic anion transporter [Arenimonas sp.]MBP6625797.1 SulP family inorganic anion transporter [Arenimonas sp.]
MAGLTAAAVVIPKAMACAVIAGLPVEVGLYTALAAMAIYPLLGSSRALSVSSTSAIAMLAAASIVASRSIDGASPATLAAALAVLVGGFLALGHVLRLGFLANFISKPVLVGFAAGVGVAIIAGQLKSLLGVRLESHDALGILRELPAQLVHAHLPTVALSVAGIVMLLGIHRQLPRWPAPLVWVAGAIGASALLDLGASGIALVGPVPSGLPRLSMPNLALLGHLWPAALGIALMCFTESMAAARTFVGRADLPVDANRELLALGAANVAAAFFGGMPAGGGTSQTAVADQAGARSQMAQWVGAAATLVTLVLLAEVIGLLPQAALAALVVVVSAGMVKPSEFGAIARVRRSEWAWAMVTFAGVVLLGTLEGIGIAVLVSVLTLIHQANHPPVYAVAVNRALGIFRRLGADASDETVPGLLMLRAEGRLTFANAANVQEKMQALAAAAIPPPRVVVLECSAIPDIEYTALMMLVEGERKQREHGVSLWLAGLNAGFEQAIDRSALGPIVGAGRRFPSLKHALDAFQAAKGAG